MPENTALNPMSLNPSVTPPHDLGLQAQFRPAEPGTAEPWLLVLMHGVGSNEQDLMGIAPWVPARYHLLSLRAPHPMGPNAWAWFQFGVAADGSRMIDTRQERHSRALVEQAVSRAAAQLGVPASRVVVGGFSQGGIMGLSLLLTRPQSLRAALSLHSRLLPEVLPEQARPRPCRAAACGSAMAPRMRCCRPCTASASWPMRPPCRCRCTVQPSRVATPWADKSWTNCRAGSARWPEKGVEQGEQGRKVLPEFRPVHKIGLAGHGQELVQ